jgi:hypothetical protein
MEQLDPQLQLEHTLRFLDNLRVDTRRLVLPKFGPN